MKYLILIFTLSYLFASTSFQFQEGQTGTLSLPDGKKINITRVLVKADSRARGLSGVPKDKFQKDEGALFIFDKTDIKRFWMPDTYFNLDIIYLDKNLKIISIDRNVPHHIGRSGKIPTASAVMCRHVLEIKAKTDLSARIKVGMKLQWTPQPLLQKAPKTRLVQ